MPPVHPSVADAYRILGLDQDASLDLIKSTYKKGGRRIYNLLEHLDPDTARDTGFWRDEDSDSDNEFYAYERMDFYMFLFEELFRRSHSRTYPGRRSYHRTHEVPGETPEQYQARLRRSREEQQAAERRRKEESEARKKRKEEERERDRQQAEQRRLDAIKAKKTQAENERKGAEATILNARKKVQTLRSSVFAAARAGQFDKVKQSIWEDGVDATGGEVNPGCDEFVPKMPKDPKETLVHIAVKHGNLELVEWLQSHNANSEEARNLDGLTPFHVALQLGNIELVKYFFDNHDPKEEDFKDVYRAPESTTLLSLAILSYEPELVWMILDKSLVSSKVISASWTWITSAEGRTVMMQHANQQNKEQLERFRDIVALVAQYGGFTPPSTPIVSEQEDHESVSTPQENAHRKKPTRSKHRRPQSGIPADDATETAQTPPSQRGRGRGRGRGWGRGRGRGQAPVSSV
ncbi:hypothetical protein CPB85DRAFT_1269435 [Mucidula mucida]|nr:hypothetical protein CPB85DRAFT_1269435 [Mucidula mucida]